MKNLVGLALLVQVCALSMTAVVAQEKKVPHVDPSGTWRWVFDGNGNSIDSALSLDADKDGKVAGTLTANDRTIQVLDGEIKGNKLTFRITFEMQNREVNAKFQGQLDGDKVKGNVTFKSEDGEREVPWEATRSVEPSDVVGVWDMTVDTPDGKAKSALTVTRNANKLAATAKGESGQETKVDEIKVENNELQYKLDIDYQGTNLKISVQGRPYGSKIKGKMQYAGGDDSGEMDFSGIRRPKTDK